MGRLRFGLIALALLVTATTGNATGDYRFTIIADDRSTDWGFDTMVSINNLGTVSWAANRTINQVQESAIFVHDGASARTLLTGSGSRMSMSNASINNLGQVAYMRSDGQQTYRITDGLTDSLMFRQGVLGTFEGGLSDNARVPTSQFGSLTAIRIVSSAGVVVESGSLGSFQWSRASAPTISDNGRNAAIAIRPGFLATSDQAAIAVLDQAHPGQLGIVTLGPATRFEVYGTSTNDHGITVFATGLTGTAEQQALKTTLVGIVDARSQTTGFRVIADTSTGAFGRFEVGGTGGVAINNLNEIAFVANPTTVQSGAFNLYKTDVSGAPATTVIKAGDAIGVDGVTFERVLAGSLDSQSINDKGQIAFLARLTAGNRSFNAILRADPVQGVSPGTPLLPVNVGGGSGGSGGWLFRPSLPSNPGGGSIPAPRRGVTRWIDPDIAVGYDYAVSPGGPAFESVQIPAPLPNGDNTFVIEFGNQTYPLVAGQRFLFEEHTPGGITSFRISGIDVSEALDPSSPQAFVTGLTFAEGGSDDFTVSMTPLIASVPEPETWAMLLAGMAIILRRTWARAGNARDR